MVNGEEKMEKEQIIENYIEHIRNISELTDEEIESVLNDAIEEDDEFLEVLETFLDKREKIREKLVTLDVQAKEEEKEEKEEIEEKDEKEEKDVEEREDLINIFEDLDTAYPIEEITERLKEAGYLNPGQIIFDAMEDLLYLDSIEDDGTIYFALTSDGEKLWESLN